MIRCDVVQGTTEWANLRLGIPTASRFDDIMSPVKMKFSASAEKYACELIAEQMLGAPIDNATSGFMQRGTILEQRARDWYEFERDVTTDPVGFVLRDDRRVGYSPDSFVGEHGLVEIKCPSAAVHVQYLLDEQGIGYRCQVQGGLWLTGREWIDTVSFNPGMASCIVRQTRDEEFIAALASNVNRFLELVDELKEKLAARGYLDLPERQPLRVA